MELEISKSNFRLKNTMKFANLISDGSIITFSFYARILLQLVLFQSYAKFNGSLIYGIKTFFWPFGLISTLEINEFQ